jgi:tetratricopeptide (TPR) repeat protein
MDFVHLGDIFVTCASAEFAQVAGNVFDQGVFKVTGSGVRLRRRTVTMERRMKKLAIRLLMLTVLSLTLAAAPIVTAVYAAPDSDPPPPPDKGKNKKKKSEVRPEIRQTVFEDSYRSAYAAIYDRHDYANAIVQLKALGRDDTAAVANLIGYSYRKLGDYKLSQVWYERALKADPNHVKTWQYYGLWQVEQGNRDQAQYHLSRIAQLACTDSEEYRSLAAALEKPPGTGPVY